MRHTLSLLLALAWAAPAAAQDAAPTAPGSVAGNPEMVQAYMRRMEWDLRNLLTAQEIHYSQHNTYAGPAADVNAVEALRFHASEAVELRIGEATTRGWSGVASSPALPGRGCALFVGGAAPTRTPGGIAVTQAGRVVCDGAVTAAAPSTDVLRADLRSLLSAQEVHYSSEMTYTSDLAGLGFVPSQGVTVRVTAANERGHAALATTNDGLGCAVFVGNAAPPRTPAGRTPTDQGRVACDGD